MGGKPEYPGDRLERTVAEIPAIFDSIGCPYWISFGALWGIIKADGMIPDGDIDICTYYNGQNNEKLIQSFVRHGYGLKKCLLNDVDKNCAVYAGFDHPMLLHICVSFWYPYGDKLFYCHDQNNEVRGGAKGCPSSYFFKGAPASELQDPAMFRDVEWPGVRQCYHVRVPRFPESMAFRWMYPDWAYQVQRFSIDPRKREVDHKKLSSYHKGGSVSPWQVEVKSMKEWENTKRMDGLLAESEKQWHKKFQETQKLIPRR